MIPKPRLLTDLIIENGNAVFDAGSKSGYVSVAPSMATFVGTPPEPLDALDASVTLNIDGASSSATIRLPTGMNIDGRAYIEMFTVNGSAGIFRTRSPQIGYGGNSTTLQLEHSINQLGDFIITDKIQEQLTVRKAFEKIFQYYASKDVQQLWMLGEVDDPKDSDVEDWEVKCVLDVDYDNCLDAVLGVMEQYPLMMLEFDFSHRPWILNVRNRPQVVMAEARLSRNVKSATVTRDDSELFTRVYMDGYKNKNGKYGHYDSTSGKKKYGLIETVISGANDTAAIAQRTVKSYMRNHKTPRISVTIDGIELSQLTGEPLDRFAIGKMMRLALPDYGETVTETLTKLVFPSIYKQPNSCMVTMNSEEDRVIRYIKKAQKSAAKAGKAAASVGKAALTKAEVINANTLRLTHGDGTFVDFSKAVTLKGYPEEKNGWSNGTYTVRAYQSNTVNGKKVETQVKSISTKISSIDLQANQSPTVDGKKLKIPLKVMYNNDGYKGNTEFTQTFTVDGTLLFNAGWKDAAGKVTIPPNIESGTIKAAVAVSYPFSIGSGSTQLNQKVSETYTMMTDPLPIQTPTRNTVVNLWRANSEGTAIGVVARISVGNVWLAGWDNAAGMVEEPSASSGDSFNVMVPKKTTKTGGVVERGKVPMAFYLTKDSPSVNGYAHAKLTGTTVAKIAIGNYLTQGWRNAADMVVIPSDVSQSNPLRFDVKVPQVVTTTGGIDSLEQVTKAFFISTDQTPSANGKAYVKQTGVTVGEIAIGGWYTAGYNTGRSDGWTAAKGKIKLPSEHTSNNTMTLKIPDSYGSTPDQQTLEYKVVVDDDKAEIRYGGITMARTSISSTTPSVTENKRESKNVTPSIQNATAISGLSNIGAGYRVYINVSGTRITNKTFYFTT